MSSKKDKLTTKYTEFKTLSQIFTKLSIFFFELKREMFQLLFSKDQGCWFIRSGPVWQNDSALCFLRSKTSAVKSRPSRNGWVFLTRDCG